MKKIIFFLTKFRIEIIIFLLSFIFSVWLMFTTFSYENGSMFVASKAWSDFANHIPLIRSFSFGNNFPPQFPLFSGPFIKYHFLFYAVVGLLEKIGLRIDYALNIPSALGFSFLILMIYLFSKQIFKSKSVGILSILLFLFNGSLEFIKFFSFYPPKNYLLEIINNNKFVSFGPYDGSTISAFWNLNIYTNQRHLALSYALSLFIFYVFIKYEKKFNLKVTLLIGIILGMSFLLNMAVFFMTVIILFLLMLFLKTRKYIFICLTISFFVALPLYFLAQSSYSSFKPILHLGYLVTNLNFTNFLSYWFQNLGFHFLLIPFSFLIVNKYNKRVFIIFFSLFIIGNLFQFSQEIAANHKFFNYFMIIGSMFSAYAIYYLWKKLLLRPFVLILFFLLIFSGIIDFFPIANDKKIPLPDYPVNKDILWIMNNTKPNSTFLNSNYLYDNASLAGRKIFLGWPYFAWSQGYDTSSRDILRKELFATSNLSFFCNSAYKNHINYVDIYLPSDTFVNMQFFKDNFNNVYKNSSSTYFIYGINKTCK